jgi:DNA-binding CsgD family transcriptional regulator
MGNEIEIGIIVSTSVGLFSTIFLWIKAKLRKSDILWLLFLTISFGNFIWYSALGLEYINGLKPLTLDSDAIFLPDMIFSSLLFVIRFIFQLYFFKLIFHVIDYSLPGSIKRVLKISGIVVLFLWFISWLEMPLRSSRGLNDRLMVYTDVLIFTSILITSIYLFFRAPYVINGKNRETIRKMSYIFLFPGLFGILKWIISDSLDIISNSFERLMIYFLIILFNSLIIWWVIRFGDSLKGPIGFIKKSYELTRNELSGKYGLTDREMDVVKLICEGKFNQEIADILFVSIDTIKDHNHNIFLKAGVKSRTQLTNLFLSCKD